MVSTNRESEASVSTYRPCDCHVKATDEHGRPERDGRKRTIYALEPHREMDLIARYRDARLRERGVEVEE